MEGVQEEDAAARAYATMSSQLKEWASPMVGMVAGLSGSSSSFLDEEEEDEEVIKWARQSSSSPLSLTPQKRSMAGTTTPIMSNSASKRQQREPSPLALHDKGDDDQIMDDMDRDIVGVQSPWPQSTSPVVARDTVSADSDHYEYRRYHDALFTYLMARQNLSERLRIQDEASQLTATAVVDPQETASLEQEETRVESDFLRALSSICLDRMSNEQSLLEGNLWSLLSALRSLGLSSLLFADDAVHQAVYQEEIDKIVSELSMDINKSPFELLHALTIRGPTVLNRRRLVLEWLEQCQELLLPQLSLPSRKQSTMWPASLERFQQGTTRYANKVESLQPDAPNLVRETIQPSFSVTPVDPLYGNDEEEDVKLLRACLSYILAGQMDRAVELCRQCGQPWRAAAWSGGTLHGVRLVPNPDTQVMDRVEEGNPHRALWKRTCWNLSGSLSNKMSPTGSSVQYEAAIYAILSNDTASALSNPVLSTWEQGVQTMFLAMMGRVEDSLLYRYNNNRRTTGKRFPFPGTEHEREEREQLQSTASLGHLTEEEVFHTVAPYSRSEASHPLRSVQAAFIIGKTAVSGYLADEGTQLEEDNLQHLRFLTHLTLYLDSLHASTTSTTVDGLEPIKNAVLLQYVSLLASRSDLWRMLATYASLLPRDALLECYPTFLLCVEGDTERRGMLKDARERFDAGLDLVILKRVVSMHLSDDSGPRPDVRKMKAILWLCHHEEHMGDALVFANKLLRQFLLQPSMTNSAVLFLSDYFPNTVTGTVTELIRDEPQKDEDGDDEAMAEADDFAMFRNAVAEHGALECYLQAYRAFDGWQSVIGGTPYTTTTVENLNLSTLTGKEKDIARSMDRRDVIRSKRQAGQAVVQAAEEAREGMLRVLRYPGGFLSQTDESSDMTDETENQRLEELASLRHLCLPQIVFLLHEVYDSTAVWMHRFLEDGIPALGKTRMDVLTTLDSGTESGSSPLTPSHWLEDSLNLAVIVASDEYQIYEAFETKDTKKFLTLMAEAEVKRLQHRENSQLQKEEGKSSEDAIEIDD